MVFYEELHPDMSKPKGRIITNVVMQQIFGLQVSGSVCVWYPAEWSVRLKLMHLYQLPVKTIDGID